MAVNPFAAMAFPAQEEAQVYGCDNCDREMPISEVVYGGDWPDSIGMICPECAEKVYRQYHPFCKNCGQEFGITNRINSSEYCPECIDGLHYYQDIIRDQNSRARTRGLVADLTPMQWKYAITYFNNHCAYCRTRPYSVIEHYIPIGKGGGTTVTNCVPACHVCNTRKMDRLPTDQHPGWEFTDEMKKRIEGYFSQF